MSNLSLKVKCYGVIGFLERLGNLRNLKYVSSGGNGGDGVG
jgi:hypothetical protein